MALSDIVAISITTATAKVLQAGFGTPMILAPHSKYVDRIRSYSDLAGLVADGFAVTDPAYLAASAILAQNPHPPTFTVGRCANTPTQQFEMTPVVSNLTVYSGVITGTDGVDHAWTYTSDGTATAAEITAGIKTAIDALALAVTVSQQSSSTICRVVANVAGAFFGLSVDDASKNALVCNHADPGMAADLAAIALVDNSWYGITSVFSSDATVAAIAAYAESNTKLYLAESQSTAILGSGTSDVASTLKTAAYSRTSLIYHHKTAQFPAAALAGVCLPTAPGSETWNFKTLAGVSASNLTTNQRTNALAKYCNVYDTVAGLNITEVGQVSAGSYVDIVRGRDWLQARMSERIFSRLANASKIPFTDAGIAIIESEIRAQLQEGITVGLLASSPAPTVTVPKASAVSANDKAARLLSGVKFDAVLAGAIHRVSITGTIAI